MTGARKVKTIILSFMFAESLVFAQTTTLQNQIESSPRSVSSLPTQTNVGGQETHGGDPNQASFIQMGRYAVQHLRRLKNSSRFTNIDPNILSEAVESRVPPVPVMRTIRCGSLTDAPACFNSSTQEILFNVTRWNSLNETQQLLLATHEFLRKSGYSREEDSYQISSELVRLVPPGSISRREYDFCPTNQPRCVFTREIRASQLTDHDLKIEFLEGQAVNAQIDRSHIVCRNRVVNGRSGTATRFVPLGSSTDALSTVVMDSSAQPRVESGGMVWGLGVSCAEAECYGWRNRFVVDDHHSPSSVRIPNHESFVSENFSFQYWDHFSRVIKRLAFVSYFNIANLRLPSDVAFTQYCDANQNDTDAVLQLRIEIFNRQ